MIWNHYSICFMDPLFDPNFKEYDEINFRLFYVLNLKYNL